MASPSVTLENRRETGKSLRQVVHRVDQYDWHTAKNRPDPVDLLVEAARDRRTELLPIKWTRMAASPFGFFRGAVPRMAFDLAALPVSGITWILSVSQPGLAKDDVTDAKSCGGSGGGDRR